MLTLMLPIKTVYVWLTGCVCVCYFYTLVVVGVTLTFAFIQTVFGFSGSGRLVLFSTLDLYHTG